MELYHTVVERRARAHDAALELAAPRRAHGANNGTSRRLSNGTRIITARKPPM